MNQIFAKLSRHKYRWISSTVVIVLTPVCILSFQNCGQNNQGSNTFAPAAASSTSVNGAAAISPHSASILPGAQMPLLALSASAGTTFVLMSGPGTVDPTTGVYTAAGEGTAVIALKSPDGSILATGSCTIVVANALALPSPTPVITPDPNPSATPAALPTATPTPVATPDPAATPDAAMTPAVTPTPTPPASLALTPNLASAKISESVSFRAMGGAAPYIYSLQDGAANAVVDANTGMFRSLRGGSYTILVTDSSGAQATASVEVSAVQLCVQGSEDTNLVMTCPESSLVKSIDFASYGTPSDCSANPVKVGSCNSPKSVSITTKVCVGNSTCTIPATNEQFVDPCEGTKKSMTIQFSCY